jgi:hypothetical protein
LNSELCHLELFLIRHVCGRTERSNQGDCEVTGERDRRDEKAMMVPKARTATELKRIKDVVERLE